MVGSLEGSKWRDDIKMEFKEAMYEIVDWIELDQDRFEWRAFVNMVIKPRVP
jgi:hypothetical protein